MTFGLTMLFMILVFWRPQDWLTPWLYGIPLLDFIVILALLSMLLESRQGKIRIPLSPAFFLIVGLYAATLLSHVMHTYLAGLLDTIPESFKPCFFTLLVLSVLDTPRRVRTVAYVFASMSALMAVHALLQQRTGFGFAGEPPLMAFRPEDGWYSRSIFFGLFEDPNDLAQILTGTIPLIFALPRRMSLGTALLMAPLAVLLFYGALSTHSRGGIIALVAMSTVVIFLALPARWMPWLLGLALVGFLGACWFHLGGVMDESARDRVIFWGMANQVFKSSWINMISGIGYGMFWQVAGDRVAHNAFVSCYTEIGMVGYWCWFGLVQLGMLGCWRARMACSPPQNAEQAYMRRLAGVSMAALAGFAASAYFLSRTFVFPMFFMLALVNAIPLVTGDLLPKEHPPLIKYRRDVLLWGTVTTLGSVIYIYISILFLNRGA